MLLGQLVGELVERIKELETDLENLRVAHNATVEEMERRSERLRVVEERLEALERAPNQMYQLGDGTQKILTAEEYAEMVRQGKAL